MAIRRGLQILVQGDRPVRYLYGFSQGCRTVLLRGIHCPGGKFRGCDCYIIIELKQKRPKNNGLPYHLISRVPKQRITTHPTYSCSERATQQIKSRLPTKQGAASPASSNYGEKGGCLPHAGPATAGASQPLQRVSCMIVVFNPMRVSGTISVPNVCIVFPDDAVNLLVREVRYFACTRCSIMSGRRVA